MGIGHSVSIANMMAILNDMEKSVDDKTQVQSLAGQPAHDDVTPNVELEEYLRKNAAVDLVALNKGSEIAAPISSGEIEPLDGRSRYGSLQMVVIDNIGHAIPNLGLKAILKEEVVFVGKTNGDGGIFIESLPIGENIEIYVKTDGGEYKRIAVAMIGARENVASLRSPKTKIELTSIYHQGQPGNATQEKERVAQQHNQKPAVEPEITGRQQRKPDSQIGRDAEGHPVARVSYGSADWFGLNRINSSRWATVKSTAANPTSGALSMSNPNGAVKGEDRAMAPNVSLKLEYLDRLVNFAEKQAGWKYLETETSDVIVEKMRRAVLETPSTKSLQQSLHACNKYVKIALAYAEYGVNGEVVGRSVSPAKLMGNELVKAGFTDVSESLGKVEITVGKEEIEQVDLVYALPGDVIVYSEFHNSSSPGHIDIRTYHGFISDFIWPGRNGFPDLKKYKVLGVYRQYSNEFSLARIKAFLRILREHEAKGYKDPYRALKYDPSKGVHSHTTFDDLSIHPSDRRSNMPAGAYQIKYNTFNAVIDATGWQPTFSEKDQDRMAMYLLQGRRVKDSSPSRTALGYILEGKIEQAIKNTRLWLEWSCLPSEGKEAQMTMDELKKKFVDYTGELHK